MKVVSVPSVRVASVKLPEDHTHQLHSDIGLLMKKISIICPLQQLARVPILSSDIHGLKEQKLCTLLY